MNGKGSRRRPQYVDDRTFAENWERAFQKKARREYETDEEFWARALQAVPCVDCGDTRLKKDASGHCVPWCGARVNEKDFWEPT